MLRRTRSKIASDPILRSQDGSFATMAKHGVDARVRQATDENEGSHA